MLLFIDVETVKDIPNKEMQDLWEKKYLEKNEGKEALYAEFGRIVCISCGYEKDGELVLKSFCSPDEGRILDEFVEILNEKIVFVGHNILSFDLPFIAKRLIINQKKIPSVLKLYDKKPREVPHVDTMRLWKMTGGIHLSLETVGCTLGVQTSKNHEVNGENISEKREERQNDVTQEHEFFEKVIQYCEADVRVVRQIYKKIMNCM